MGQDRGPFLIGRGRLSWPRNERVSDRYGTVHLMDGGDSLSVSAPAAKTVVRPEDLGRRAKLTAVVTETRESTHIGDLFRGFYPSTPDVGDELIIGEGHLFTEQCGEHTLVGLDPRDGRESDWLDPNALYRLHEQTVELRYELLEEGGIQ